MTLVYARKMMSSKLIKYVEFSWSKAGYRMANYRHAQRAFVVEIRQLIGNERCLEIQGPPNPKVYSDVFALVTDTYDGDVAINLYSKVVKDHQGGVFVRSAAWAGWNQYAAIMRC